jgi:hypothetical protein
MASWDQAKSFLEHGLDISRDALHVLIGILAWLIAALLLRRPISSWRPWLWLVALAAFNEVLDLASERWPDAAMQLGEGAKDFALTLLVPTVLMFASRYRPDLFRQSPRRPGRGQRK